MGCSKMKLKAWHMNEEIKIDEKSLTEGMLLFTFDPDSNATLHGYLTYAEYIEGLHRHRMKVKSAFPLNMSSGCKASALSS